MEFIPCVEVFNNPDAFGTEGSGEFEFLKIRLLLMMMVKNISKIILGNPILSSRPKQDIVCT